MNVRDLIERLEGCDPEAEVVLATQPSWPMQAGLRGVASAEDVAAETACSDHDEYHCPVCPTPAVVYLVEGTALADPYAPRAAFEVAS